MKCPYCNEELKELPNGVGLSCPNPNCILFEAEPIIIVDLIDGLCAIDALENIVDNPFRVLTQRGYELAKLALDSRLQRQKAAIAEQGIKE